MRKFLFLERPHPSPETARTAGSCVSAEGHIVTARAHKSARAFSCSSSPVAPVPKPCPKSGQIRLESPRWGRDLEGGHTAPHRPLQRGIPLPQGMVHCGRKIRKYSSGPDTRCRYIISPH